MDRKTQVMYNKKNWDRKKIAPVLLLVGLVSTIIEQN